MSSDLNIRKFDIREAGWETDGDVLQDIRRRVFIIEQNVPKDEEWDGQDEKSWHFLATEKNDVPIGTARLLPSGQIGRMAVLEEYRRRGVGRALLEQAIDKARHLGMQDLFLHAQLHALHFYETVGFSLEGEEFTEAGIAHRKMSLVLTPFDDNVQRRIAVNAEPDLDVKDFDTREVLWDKFGKLIRVVRQSVLVGELDLPESFVKDDVDSVAIHWVAEDDSGQTIGSVRMTVEGDISRLAVLPEHRHKGIGHTLIELAVTKARRYALKEVRADVLTDLAPMYIDGGFSPDTQTHTTFGHKHQKLTKILDDEDQDVTIRGLVGNELEDVAYRLGEDKKHILLRREDDFQNVIVEMCRQATHSIRILSPLLDHKLFNNAALKQVFSALARRNKYTFIEILLYDSHRIVTNSHGILEISRKLPSSIRFKIVHPELRQQNHEFMVVDGCGLVHRLDHEVYEGYANFRDVTEANRLTRQFVRAWESGLHDPNLRTLRI